MLAGFQGYVIAEPLAVLLAVAEMLGGRSTLN